MPGHDGDFSSVTDGMGRTQFRDNLAVAAEDYTDWSVAVSRSFGPAEVSLGYFGTDASARASFGKLADNRLLLSSLPIDRHRRQNEKGAGRRLFRIRECLNNSAPLRDNASP
nr:TorF family putative porin [Thermomonas hydrothermalis]